MIITAIRVAMPASKSNEAGSRLLFTTTRGVGGAVGAPDVEAASAIGGGSDALVTGVDAAGLAIGTDDDARGSLAGGVGGGVSVACTVGVGVAARARSAAVATGWIETQSSSQAIRTPA